MTFEQRLASFEDNEIFGQHGDNTAIGLCAVGFAGVLPSQHEDDRVAVDAAKKLAASILECPRREVVGESKKKWVKEAWGPPQDVKYDVEKTASIVHPYKIIIEFSLSFSFGPERKTREEALNDADLRPFSRARYRNIYDYGWEIFSLTTQVSDRNGGWINRPKWPDACCDTLKRPQFAP